jgi:hypothetical protein
MMKRFFHHAPLLVVLACSQAVPATKTPPAVVHRLPHEGKAVNGLRLEVAARFIPEEPGWGSPKLAVDFTFINDSNAPILLNTCALSHSLQLTRIEPLDGISIRTDQPMEECFLSPTEEDVRRIPAGEQWTMENWIWANSLEVYFGRLSDGRIVPDTMHHLYTFERNGAYTLAYVYRTTHRAYNFRDALQKFLRDGERLWSGEVYSNAVAIDVSVYKKPVRPDNFSGVWTEYYVDGQKSFQGAFINGIPDGRHVHWWPRGPISYEETYRNGVRHGKYITYDRNERKAFEQTIVEGKAEGAMFAWHGNGRLKFSIDVKSGLRHGRQVEYDADGNIRVEGQHVNGQMEGVWIERDSTGKIVSEKRYHQGQEVRNQ